MWWNGVLPTMFRGTAWGPCLKRREEGEGVPGEGTVCVHGPLWTGAREAIAAGLSGRGSGTWRTGWNSLHGRRLCGFRFLCHIRYQFKKYIDLRTS